MHKGASILASALLVFLAATTAGATDQENFEKARDKYLSSDTLNPKKGLCICISDVSALSLKRVGFMFGGIVGDSIAVSCVLPRFDGAGARIGPEARCEDWVPLAK